jgi:hypothetical protein
MSGNADDRPHVRRFGVSEGLLDFGYIGHIADSAPIEV